MFVNFAWVFFRANEWSDAIKVLRGMVSINNIVLPQRLEISLYSISEKFNFGVWGGAIQANNWTLLWLMTGLVIVLCFDNSIERGQKFLPTKMAYIYSAVIFSISFMSLDRANEFLYFNF